MTKKTTTDNKASTASGRKRMGPGEAILNAALAIAEQCELDRVLLFVDGLEEMPELKVLRRREDDRLILVTRADESYEWACELSEHVVRVPPVQLTRIGQIKMAVMLSFSQRYLRPGDRFVSVTGSDQGCLDTLMMMEVGKEYELFHSVDQPPLTEHIRRAVFERVLNLALELAAEGREGKPVGALFVLGDATAVLENSRQTIMNPFHGYQEEQCSILDDQITETVKEFSSIDGAFVIKGNGTICSAGTMLLPKVISEDLPQGLGARHVAAAAITAATKSIAVTISESTGTVRIWRQGRLITEIDKAKTSHHTGSVKHME